MKFMVDLPDEMHEELRQRAEREDRSMSATVRQALREYMGGGNEDDR